MENSEETYSEGSGVSNFIFGEGATKIEVKNGAKIKEDWWSPLCNKESNKHRRKHVTIWQYPKYV